MVYRTHNLGELRVKNIGEVVTLSGWVDTKRNVSTSLTFIDLRDREGKTQIVFNNELLSEKVLEEVQKLKSESVIRVVGEVKERSNKNLNIPTGEIEVFAKEIEILNACDTLPFQISGVDDNLSENMRLTYRYLDIRRSKMLNNLKMRHRMIMSIRNYMDQAGFLDVDTPILTKSTPEGARDFLVPSRTNPGTFYALPQSPQLFKQLLMIGGVEKYFQIAKCFRDEDLRADRQPEFTQLDIEMSFVEKEDVMNEIEGLAKYVFKNVTGEEANYTFQRMPYAEAMDRFGSDKPDLRFGVELKDLSDIVKNSSFNAFSSTVQNGGLVKAVVAPNANEKFSRKFISEYEEYVKTYFGAKGLAYIKLTADGITSPIAKFFSEETMKKIIEKLGIKNNEIALILADSYKTVHDGLGALRLKLGEDLGLIDKDAYKFLWVVDFPMFEWSEEENGQSMLKNFLNWKEDFGENSREETKITETLLEALCTYEASFIEYPANNKPMPREIYGIRVLENTTLNEPEYFFIYHNAFSEILKEFPVKLALNVLANAGILKTPRNPEKGYEYRTVIPRKIAGSNKKIRAYKIIPITEDEQTEG